MEKKKIKVIFFFSHKNGTKYYDGKNIKGIINISNIMWGFVCWYALSNLQGNAVSKPYKDRY